MKKNYNSKLKQYSAIVGGVVAITNTDAVSQVITRDVDPDAVISGNYDLDIDGDGNVDFTISKKSYYGKTHFYFTGVGTNLGDGNKPFAGSSNTHTFVTSGNDYYVAKLNFGDITSFDTEYNDNVYTRLFQAEGGNLTGNFQWTGGTTDKYVGVQFTRNGKVHFGWVKMNVAADYNSVTITEVGYQSTPELFSKAGVTSVVPAVSNIKALITGDAGNPSDVIFSFDKASDESNIVKYRMFIVPKTDSATTTQATVQNLAAGRYYDITPTGSNISTQLPADLTDINGNPIMPIEYTFFVMSYANATNLDAMVASNELKTQEPVPSVKNIVLADISDNQNASDLSISFDMAMDETNIESYHVLVVPSSQSITFDLASAQAAALATNSTIVTKSGSNYTLTLPTNAKDVNGATITENKFYSVFVLSKAAGIEFADSLSAPSDSLELKTIITGISTNSTKARVSNKGNILSFANIADGASVVVTNSTGAEVYTAALTTGNSSISLSNVQSGLYIVKVTDNNGTFTSKMFITAE
jgi:hypothetical protein